MADEWDLLPMVLSPPYAYNPYKPGAMVWGANGRYSAEELAEASKRMEELNERIRQDHERKFVEARSQWPQRRIELVKTRIRFLRGCQRKTGAKRPRSMRGRVYLMWCPSIPAHKIGYTDNLHRRIAELRLQLDPEIVCHTDYRSPVSLPLLEKLLHQHFSHGRLPSEKSEELFRLAPQEVGGFEATTAAIERCLLAVEILRLSARLSALDADLKEAK